MDNQERAAVLKCYTQSISEFGLYLHYFEQAVESSEDTSGLIGQLRRCVFELAQAAPLLEQALGDAKTDARSFCQSIIGDARALVEIAAGGEPDMPRLRLAWGPMKQHHTAIGNVLPWIPKPIPQPEPGDKRPCYDRDHTFLAWHEAKGEATHRSPANIRDRWNGENDDNVSIETVNTAIKKARKERENGGKI